MLLGFSVGAYAGYAYGSYLYFNNGGYSYESRSFIYTGSGPGLFLPVIAYTSVGSTTASIPAGYEGAQAWAYQMNSTNSYTLVGYSMWYYNDSAMPINNKYIVSYEFYSIKGPSFVSYGYSQTYNSASGFYTQYRPNQSPAETVM